MHTQRSLDFSLRAGIRSREMVASTAAQSEFTAAEGSVAVQEGNYRYECAVSPEAVIGCLGEVRREIRLSLQ